MRGRGLRVVGLVRRFFEAKLDLRGLAYPWWIPLFTWCGLVIAVLVSLAQRDALWPLEPVTAALLLVLVAPVPLYFAPVRIAWCLDSALLLGATALLLAHPLHVSGPADTAPMLLVIMTATVTARDGVVPGLVVYGLAVVVLVLAGGTSDLPSTGLYALEVDLGLAVGFLLRWQMHQLAAERLARAGERERATLAERERIARDIHDLVAHSLSVTLLHLTGARQALRDGDLADAQDALADAERVGRQAMADIRRTVSAMAADRAPTRPLPVASDIGTLVDEFAAAGLDVRYDVAGDPTVLQPGAGLGLYRITQEALSNVAKHAPGSPVDVTLHIDRSTARLAVRNELNGTRPRPGEGGSGVPGMTARATGLGAAIRIGPEAGSWLVDVRLPLDARCVLKRVAP